MGVEPTTSAWEANVLPINYIRIMLLFYHLFLCLSRVYCEKIRKTLSDKFLQKLSLKSKSTNTAAKKATVF